VSGMTPDEEAIKARMDEIAAGIVREATAEVDDEYKRRRENALSDAWMLADVLAAVPTRTKRVRSATLLLIISTLIDQAAELESLRDGGDRWVAPGVLIVPDTEAVRIITDADQAGQLPTGSVIIDDSGRGPAWIIEEDSVNDSWAPAFNGRKVRGIAGFGGVGYSVVYPAVLIHTPKEPTV
jgi:hypothetical protein